MINDLAEKLSNIDDIEPWNTHCSSVDAENKKQAFILAEPLWIKRMVQSGKLFLNPEVLKQLEMQNWIPNDLQKRMIWASVLGSDESSDSKKRFYVIKEKLLAKYGRDWWEDVYLRKTNVYAAKQRIKNTLSGPVMSAFVSNTFLGASCAEDEKQKALKMIPKN